MPEYQILLLPRPDYWNWVRAVRDYVMAFGVAITGDADNAGRHMAPSQTISVVNAPNAYLGHPVHGEIGRHLAGERRVGRHGEGE